MGYDGEQQEAKDEGLTPGTAPGRLVIRDPWSRRCSPREPQAAPSIACASGSPERCVWAAEIGGRLVGTIGLVPLTAHLARIQWFRIDPDWQHTAILSKLIAQVHDHCRKQGYFRVALDAHIAPQWIWRVLVRRGFRLMRRVRGPQGEQLEFALEPRPQVA